MQVRNNRACHFSRWPLLFLTSKCQWTRSIALTESNCLAPIPSTTAVVMHSPVIAATGQEGRKSADEVAPSCNLCLSSLLQHVKLCVCSQRPHPQLRSYVIPLTISLATCGR